MKIEVTQTDIDKSKTILSGFSATINPRSKSCPIALALARALGEDVSVGFSSYSRYNSNKFGLDLPPKATKFINDFDSEKPVKPFSFEIEDDV